MLVGYSSSSEEESEAATDRSKRFYRTCPEKDGGDNASPARKKPKIDKEQVAKTRLPVPGSLLEMFPDDVSLLTEESSLHGGRVRSFKHEQGNWATYVYLPYHPEVEFGELLEDLLSLASAHGTVWTPQKEFHLSLSQTVVLRHHWIQPFNQSLRAGLEHCKRFVCTAERLRVYCNAERTRTFLGMEVCTGHAQLLELVQVVDRTMMEFCLETFYQEPSFHVSLAWCVGDLTDQMGECIQRMQSLSDDHEGGPFLQRLDCVELRLRTGNKTFHFPLKP